MLLGLSGFRLPDQAPALALQRGLRSPGADRDRRAHGPVSGGRSAQPGTVGRAPDAASPRLPASRPSPCCGLCLASYSALPLASLGVHPQLTAHILHLLFSCHSFLSVRFYSRLPHPMSAPPNTSKVSASLPHPNLHFSVSFRMAPPQFLSTASRGIHAPAPHPGLRLHFSTNPPPTPLQFWFPA